MRFPTLEDGSINESEAEKMLDYALANGVTYVDTAYFIMIDNKPFVGKVFWKNTTEILIIWRQNCQLGVLKDGQDTLRVFTEHYNNYVQIILIFI